MTPVRPAPAERPSERKVTTSAGGEAPQYDYHPSEELLEARPNWPAESFPQANDCEWHEMRAPHQTDTGSGFHGEAVEWNGNRFEINYPGIPGHELLLLFLIGDDGRHGYAILKRKVVSD